METWRDAQRVVFFFWEKEEGKNEQHDFFWPAFFLSVLEKLCRKRSIERERKRVGKAGVCKSDIWLMNDDNFDNASKY